MPIRRPNDVAARRHPWLPARTGRVGAVQALLEKGAKVDAQDREDQTALMPTITAISEIMRANGIEPPPPPDRDALPKKKGYEQR